MVLRLSASADYQLADETFLLLMVEPPLEGSAHKVTQESLRTTPTPYARLDADRLGNPQRRLLAPRGFFTFDFTATVEVEPNDEVPERAREHAPLDLSADILWYTLPSRYCPSDVLTRFALGEFGKLPPGGARVRAISEWVHSRIEYQYGTSDATTSASDTLIQRIGVCRDFAHLTISFCRALGIPARYASGYCLELDPPDFHAWVQVYLGGAWHNVDATFDGIRPALVPIAFGRDAADVPMVTLWGEGECRAQSVEVSRLP
jgi:transglutaminase-like putative cysteine protease